MYNTTFLIEISPTNSLFIHIPVNSFGDLHTRTVKRELFDYVRIIRYHMVHTVHP